MTGTDHIVEKAKSDDKLFTKNYQAIIDNRKKKEAPSHTEMEVEAKIKTLVFGALRKNLKHLFIAFCRMFAGKKSKIV